MDAGSVGESATAALVHNSARFDLLVHSTGRLTIRYSKEWQDLRCGASFFTSHGSVYDSLNEACACLSVRLSVRRDKRSSGAERSREPMQKFLAKTHIKPSSSGDPFFPLQIMSRTPSHTSTPGESNPRSVFLHIWTRYKNACLPNCMHGISDILILDQRRFFTQN